MFTEATAMVRLHELLTTEDHAIRDETEVDRCKEEINRSLLARYEQLRRRYGSGALAEVEGNTCTGCRVSLPSAQVNRLNSGLGVCDSCGRILFNPNHVYRFQY